MLDSLIVARFFVFALVAAGLTGVVRADAPASTGRDALPAIDRVFVPLEPSVRVGFAGTAGYRLTESQAGEGAHHRPEGTLAAAITPLPKLAVSLAVDAGYDVQPDKASSAVAVPRLNVLFWRALHRQLQLGAAVTFTTAASFQFSAPVLTGLLLGAWQPHDTFTLVAQGGFRFDDSAHAVADREALAA
ncbi:MAG: hypothetical protein RL701_7625, partial [Pseudomonadota bacterium]